MGLALHIEHHSPQPGRALRCATIVRVSTAEQAAEGRAGIDRQREVIRRTVADKRYQVIEEIELVDVSGTSILHAPEIRKLLERIERGEVDTVLASEMTRLIRPDDLTSFDLLDACKRNGVTIDTGGVEHDFSSPEGFLSGGILALLGGHERMQMLRRMMQSKEAKRARGQNPQSEITLPLGIGYDRAAERYTLTADIGRVIEAFRLVDEEGLRSLTEVGRRTGIHQANVRNILSNPIYRGERVYSKYRDQSKKRIGPNGRQGDRPKIARPAEKIIRVKIFASEEQPVADERWQRVQEVLRGISENHEIWVAERHRGNLLAGVGRCGFCGERLYGKRRNRKLADKSDTKGHYLCRSHHETMTKRPGNIRCRQGWNRMEELDELVEAFLLRWLADTDFVQGVISNARSKQAGKIVGMNVADAMKERLSDLERRDRRILDALEDGACSPAEAKQRRQRIADERSQLIRSIEGQEEQAEQRDELKGIARQIAEGLKGWPAKGTVKERKAFLQRVFSEIYFRGAEITAFRLAPGLLGTNLGCWSFVSDMPVALDPPVRLKEPEPEVIVPEGHKHCNQCKTTKPLAEFYPKRSACKRCVNKASTTYYRRKRDKEREERGS